MYRKELKGQSRNSSRDSMRASFQKKLQDDFIDGRQSKYGKRKRLMKKMFLIN